MSSQTEHIAVYINGKKVMIYRGMAVKHALISMDYSVYKAALDGRLIIEDEDGFRVGLEGSLSEGAKLFTRTRRSPVA